MGWGARSVKRCEEFFFVFPKKARKKMKKERIEKWCANLVGAEGEDAIQVFY